MKVRVNQTPFRRQQNAVSLSQNFLFVPSNTAVSRTNISCSATAVQISFPFEPHFFASFHFPF